MFSGVKNLGENLSLFFMFVLYGSLVGFFIYEEVRWVIEECVVCDDKNFEEGLVKLWKGEDFNKGFFFEIF